MNDDEDEDDDEEAFFSSDEEQSRVLRAGMHEREEWIVGAGRTKRSAPYR